MLWLLLHVLRWWLIGHQHARCRRHGGVVRSLRRPIRRLLLHLIRWRVVHLLLLWLLGHGLHAVHRPSLCICLRRMHRRRRIGLRGLIARNRGVLRSAHGCLRRHAFAWFWITCYSKPLCWRHGGQHVHNRALLCVRDDLGELT